MDCLRSCYQAFSPSKRGTGSVAHNDEYSPTDRIIQNGTDLLKNKIQGFIDVLKFISSVTNL